MLSKQVLLVLVQGVLLRLSAYVLCSVQKIRAFGNQLNDEWCELLHQQKRVLVATGSIKKVHLHKADCSSRTMPGVLF